jgi:ABC-type transport system involved in multi-copper enzyme maturation permease subunit
MITDIGGAMAALGVIVLMLVFILKLMNVMRSGVLYDGAYVFVGFVVSLFAFFFVLVGSMTELTVIITAYLQLASVILVGVILLMCFEILLLFVPDKNKHKHLETSLSRLK